MTAGAGSASDAWSAVLGAVLAYTAMGFVFALYVQVVGPAPEDPVGEVEHGMVGQAFASLAPIALALFWRIRGVGWRGRHGPGLWILGAYALAMVVWVPFTFWLYPQIVEPTPQPHLAYFAEEGPRPAFWVVLAVVCVLGPIAEEIVFRGFLQTGLRGLIGPVWGLLATSVLFGFMHGLDIGLPLALLGLLFGYLRERDRGMLAPILAHVLHNTVTVAVTMRWPELFDEVFSR